jgi:hypothetical protein
MVLLLAMMLAIAAGMMVGGPIVIAPADHAFAAQGAWLGIPHASLVLACLPLAAAGIRGWRAARACGWPEAVRTPWLAFMASCIALTGVAIAYHLRPGDTAMAFTHIGAALAMTMLSLCFLAERVDALFGRPEALAGGCAVAGFAGLWWFAGHWVGGQGDLRALLFLESLPLLLVPAGALSLPGPFTRAADWLLMLALYLLARLAGFGDALVHSASGWISGHALMHLLLAAVVACPAYRMASASRRAGAVRGMSVAEPTQRSTSFHTSS